jgi:hypothetical protein
MLAQEAGDWRGVGGDSSDVAAYREAAHDEGSAGMSLESHFQKAKIWSAVTAHRHHLH